MCNCIKSKIIKIINKNHKIFIQMTLYINVLSTENMPEGGTLIVQGSRAGILACERVEANSRLGQVFRVKCASDDILNFKLVRNTQQYQKNRYISQGTIHAQSLTKRHRNQLLGYNMGSYQPGESAIRGSDLRYSNPNVNEQVNRTSTISNSHLNFLKYEVQLYSPEEKFSGLLHTTIAYDPVSHFEGQFCSAAERQKAQLKNKVALFKGKCPTKNLFSILDPACDYQQSKFVESIYKDSQIIYR